MAGKFQPGKVFEWIGQFGSQSVQHLNHHMRSDQFEIDMFLLNIESVSIGLVEARSALRLIECNLIERWSRCLGYIYQLGTGSDSFDPFQVMNSRSNQDQQYHRIPYRC